MGTNTPAIDVLAPEALKKRLGVKHCPFLWELLMQERFSHGSNFEKLGLPKSSLIVYSLRLNHKERVLLTKHELGGQYYWVVLDYLEHHEYDKSAFLKAGHLKQYLSLEKNVKGLISLGKKESTTAASAAPQAIAGPDALTAASPTTAAAAAVEVEPTIHKELHPFNNEFIVLNADQEKALALSEPMLLTGMPGSGKSAVAVTYLTQCLSPLLEPTAAAVTPPFVVYVAESELLVKQMKTAFGNSPLGQTAMAQRLLFLSYDALLLREYPALKDLKRVNKADFYTWFNGLQRQELAALKTKLGSKTAELVYQELRMMSGMSMAEYEAIGGRASPLWIGEAVPVVSTKKAGSATAMSPAEQQTKLRETIYELKKEYCSHLTTNKRYDSSFFALPPQSKTHYSHIAVDEAQDFSTRQLRTLQALALPASKGPAIAYFADSHQSVEDNFPKHHFFKTILKIAHLGELPLTYRCSKEVLAFANNLLGMQYHVTGGQMDKGGKAFINTTEQMASGSACWLPEKAAHQSAAMHNHLVALTNTPQCAVITADELIKEAQTRFPGAIVLTPKQAKGLEYDDIILYRLFEHPYYKQMNQLLANFEGCDVSAAVHRAKAGAANYEYTALFNGVFTAITRARKHLYLLLPQDKKELHAIEYVVSALKLGLSQNTPVPQASAVSVATKEDWIREIKLQLEHGNRPVALNLALQHLGMNETQFDQHFSNNQNEKQDSKGRDARDTKEDTGSQKDQKTPPTAPQVLATTTKKSQQSAKPPTAILKKSTAVVTTKKKTVSKKGVKREALHGKITPQIQAVLDAPKDRAFASIYAFLQQEDFFEQLFHVAVAEGISLYLAMGGEKRALLYQIYKSLIKGNPKFADRITLKSLCREQLWSANQTPLFDLTIDKHGIDLLTSLLNNPSNEWIKDPSFLHALYSPLPKEAGNFANRSALCSLSKEAEGILLISTLISNNLSLFATKEFVAALCLPTQAVTISGGSLSTSALTYLCNYSNGLKALNSMITYCPELFSTKEFIAALFCPYAAEGPFAHANIFAKLCASNEGYAIIDKLTAINMSLFATKECMTAICVNHLQPGDSMPNSGLYWLSKASNGRALLSNLMGININLFATKEFVLALCMPRSGPGPYTSTSPVYWLCNSAEGVLFLRKLLAASPKLLATEKFVESLCRSIPQGEVNTSGLFLLCADPSRFPLIGSLSLANLSLFTTPKVAAALCLSIPATAQSNPNLSALAMLCTSPQGLRLLEAFATNNTHLCKEKTFISTLKLILPPSIGKNESALSLLHKTADGFALLLKMAKQNPALHAEMNFGKLTDNTLGDFLAPIEQTQQPRFFSAEATAATATATAAATNSKPPS